MFGLPRLFVCCTWPAYALAMVAGFVPLHGGNYFKTCVETVKTGLLLWIFRRITPRKCEKQLLSETPRWKQLLEHNSSTRTESSDRETARSVGFVEIIDVCRLMTLKAAREIPKHFLLRTPSRKWQIHPNIWLKSGSPENGLNLGCSYFCTEFCMLSTLQ